MIAPLTGPGFVSLLTPLSTALQLSVHSDNKITGDNSFCLLHAPHNHSAHFATTFSATQTHRPATHAATGATTVRYQASLRQCRKFRPAGGKGKERKAWVVLVQGIGIGIGIFVGEHG